MKNTNFKLFTFLNELQAIVEIGSLTKTQESSNKILERIQTLIHKFKKEMIESLNGTSDQKLCPVLDEQNSLSKVALVVDDDNTSRVLVEQMLLKEGISADTATSGAEATTMAYFFSYHFFVIDLSMPNGSGISFAKNIRLLPQYTDTPIIVLTACLEEEAKQECLNAGINYFLTKPTDMPSLRKALTEVGILHQDVDR